jgi:signal transduction histidine kinase
MSKSKPLIRFPIAYKLLFWCISMILIFFLTTGYLLDGLRAVVSSSSQIVNVNHRAAEGAERMMQQVLNALEYTKRYRILENEQDRAAYRSVLLEYGRNLDTLGEGEQATVLKGHFALAVNGEGEWVGEPDEAVGQWLETLAAVRDENRSRMRSDLESLTARSQSAATIGLAGMIISLLFGLSGSVLIAVLLNRSLRELRSGITRLHRTGAFEPVRRRSGDELGDLAVAFNQMAARLSKEEELRLEFLAMLNHEMEAPLHTIEESLGRVAKESTDRLTPAQQRVLTICEREVNRLSHLMNRLLRLSTFEVGGMPVNPKPLDVKTLLDDTVERIQPAAQAKEVQLSISGLKGPLTVLGDSEHIRQVLLNLFGNALSRSTSGSTIGVRVDPGPDGERLLFRIGDKGAEIPLEEQERLFEPYYRSSFLGDEEHAGLDLSISKRIVEVHGGSMWYVNKPGRGNIFGFSLPMIRT